MKAKDRFYLSLIAVLALVAAFLGGMVWYMRQQLRQNQDQIALLIAQRGSQPTPAPTPTVLPSAVFESPTPLPSSPPVPSATPPPAVEPGFASTPGPATPVVAPSISPGGLLIPVQGVVASQLRDTYTDARSEGRVHNAIDIMAPGGTPVLAAADGKIVAMRYSDRGGITIYELAPDNRTIYYYAHLQSYAAGIAEGQTIRRGQLLAYVGDTGNAGPGNTHLHFSISVVTDPKRYWDGVNVNPYPLLGGK